MNRLLREVLEIKQIHLPNQNLIKIQKNTQLLILQCHKIKCHKQLPSHFNSSLLPMSWFSFHILINNFPLATGVVFSRAEQGGGAAYQRAAASNKDNLPYPVTPCPSPTTHACVPRSICPEIPRGRGWVFFK